MGLREGCRVSRWLIFISFAGLSPAQSQTADFLGQDAGRVRRPRGAVLRGDGNDPPSAPGVDGTRIERKLMGKVFRDGACRVRREQTIVGLAALNFDGHAQPIVTIVDPVAGVSYVIDSARQIAHPTTIDRPVWSIRSPPPPTPPPPSAQSSRAAPPPPPPAPPRPGLAVVGNTFL